jgi:hypothetical protein
MRETEETLKPDQPSAVSAVQPVQALEQAWLVGQGVAPGLACLAAARMAALACAGAREVWRDADFAALPDWIAGMGSEVAPIVLPLPATAEDEAQIRKLWHLLGTAEALLETGGDIRLAKDPRSGLNGYGCSHRPRPWAITFSSSTASSSSERGYAAADAARLRATADMLKHGARAPIQAALGQVRAKLTDIYQIPAGGAVVLAASGTDTELLALALTHLAPQPKSILNILVAPEETGSGVPMAARGLHFAVDTALGHDVSRAAPIEGFRADTTVRNVALRGTDGAVRDAAEVEAELAEVVADGIANGRRVILHGLDLSKTGLVAPRLAFLQKLRAAHGAAFDIVIDACQARLSRGSVARYLALDSVVLITGSKFFTGPPFAGALLLPPEIAARLQSGALPRGLDAYFGRDEFPEICPAADALPPVGNYGLALRWHAALAEINAVLAVPRPIRTQILQGFAAVVAEQIARYPALTIYPAPAILRGDDDEDWERCASIFSFSLALPDPSQNFAQSSAQSSARCLTPEQARLVYQWLNADLSPSLPAANADERSIAATICHIGQPVKLPAPDGFIGVLRVCAGARLLSGEPSHGGMADEARIAREFDDLRIVFAKIDLILKNFSALEAASPMPCYRAW